jgi:hypothetical protein
MNDKKKIIDEIIKFVMLGNPSIQKKNTFKSVSPKVKYIRFLWNY